MTWVGERWTLHAGDELVGVITIEDQDFPWLSGAFTAEPAFARWAPLFAAEQALLDEVTEHDSAEGWARWEAAYDRISAGLTLTAPTEPVADFLLHIEDGRAWLRWSSEEAAE
jgi:hypothetical protein